MGRAVSILTKAYEKYSKKTDSVIRGGPCPFPSRGCDGRHRMQSPLLKDEWTGCHNWSPTSSEANRPNGNTRFPRLLRHCLSVSHLDQDAEASGELYQALFFTLSGLQGLNGYKFSYSSSESRENVELSSINPSWTLLRTLSALCLHLLAFSCNQSAPFPVSCRSVFSNCSHTLSVTCHSISVLQAYTVA